MGHLYRQSPGDSVRGQKKLNIFNRILTPKPLAPATLQGIDIGIAGIYELLRQPGAGKLIGSGAVEYQGGILGILGGPLNNIALVTHGSFNLKLA